MQKIRLTSRQYKEAIAGIYDTALSNCASKEIRYLPSDVRGRIGNITSINQWKEYINAEFAHLNSLMNLVIGAVNTIAGKAVIDAKDELYQRKDLWRFDIKKNARLAEDSYYEYEKIHTRNFGDRYNLFLDYLSAVEDNIAKDVNMLTMSIAQVLTKHNQKDSMLKAKVETARTMSEYACSMFDMLIEKANTKVNTYCMNLILSRKMKPFNFKPYFEAGKITGVFHYWDKVTSVLCKPDNKGESITLNDDPNCKLAFEIIERKITSEDFLNKAGYDALQLNPDCISTIAAEDYQELVDKFGK
ncbi:MAG: hypothetical protein ACI4TK_19170 [Agathobacter sp.]